MEEQANDTHIHRGRLVPPRYPKAEALAHGEPKKLKQFMITDSSAQKLDGLADELETSRSEALEQLIRGGAIELFLKRESLKKRSKLRSKAQKPN